MTLLAPRIERIKPSPSSMAVRRVRELRESGSDVIGLASGEPDFDTPEWVKQAAIRAMAEAKTKYTNVDGTPELKKAIREKFKRENGLDYSLEEICVGTGAKQLIFNAILATVSPGDEVIIPAPYWVSYPDMALLADGIPVFVDCKPSAAFKMSAADLERAITPRTKWLILNSPCNPSGATYTREELGALAEVLLRHPQVWVLADDIYEHIIYDDREFVTISKVEPSLKERTLTINGVSKSYAMTGWRIGYGCGPALLIKAMVKLQSQSTSNACSISQAAAQEALSGPQDLIREHKSLYQERRDMVVAMLNRASGISCRVPEGAFYVFPSCEGVIGKKTPSGSVIKTDYDFAMYLLESKQVAVLHGAAYGMSPFFRVSFAASLDLLQKGCRRIQEACADLK